MPPEQAFEVPAITLTGSIAASVHEHGGVVPATVIRAGTDWAVSVRWSLQGSPLVAGTWHIHVNLESLGPGPELSLFDLIDPACQNQTFPNASGNYACHFDVPGGAVNPADIPHQGLPMKLVVVLTALDTLGNPAPIAAFFEGPILMFYP